MTQQYYDLLSIGAHPDDVEVGSGGILIDLSKRGHKCGIVILTQGELGTGGTAINELDLETGERRLSTNEDTRLIAKLIDALDNVHVFNIKVNHYR